MFPTAKIQFLCDLLSFNEDDPPQGLFLIAANGHTNASTEIRLEDLSLATSTKIIFRTPDNLTPAVTPRIRLHRKVYYLPLWTTMEPPPKAVVALESSASPILLS